MQLTWQNIFCKDHHRTGYKKVRIKSNLTPKFIRTKYYRHLKKAIWADRNGIFSGRLACTSRKTELLKKIGI